MSFVRDLVFGSKGTPSQVVNTTAKAYQDLAPTLANQLRTQLLHPDRYAYQGPFTADMGPLELQALLGANQAAQGVGVPGAGQQMLAGAAGFNPFAQLSALEQFGLGQVTQQAFNPSNLTQQANSALSGLLGGGLNPYAQAAGLTGAEQQGLNAIQQQAFASNPQLQGFLGQQLGGVMNPFAQLSGAEQQGLNAIQQTAFGANPLQNTVNQQLGAIAGSGVHPQLDQLIQAATRPILEQFGDDMLAQRGAFTAAGQQVQGQGSSPFAQASARLTSGVANAVGDTSAKLTQALNAQQQQAQLAALGMAQQQPGLQLQNQLAAQSALGLPRELQREAFNQMQANQFAAAGLGDQYANNQLARALQGQSALALPREIAQTGLNLQNQAFQQAQANQLAAAGLGDQLTGNAFQRALAGLSAAGIGQERGAAAFENQQNRQLQAGGELGQQQLQSQVAQLQAQLQNLQAQGLPRMIQQLGIDAGLAQFNQQQNNLLQLMNLIGAVSGSNPVVLPGQAATEGLLHKFVGGLGAGLGGAVASDRRLKQDIEHVATLPSGTKLYQFRYKGGNVTHIGVMADEVAHIPGAVTVEPLTGIALVDYRKVA